MNAMNTLSNDMHLAQNRSTRRLPRFGRMRKLALETFETAQFVTEALRQAAQQRRERRAIRRQQRILARLDERTLKDIGLHRAEIGSISAELEGHAETTRRRVPKGSVAPLY